MKYIKLYLSILVFSIAFACNDSQSDLLEPRLYFENKQVNIDVEDIDTYEVEILSRLSNLLKKNVNVEYQIGDESYVEAYNQKYGTTFSYMPKDNFTLLNNSSVIKAGETYAEACKLELTNLLNMEEGNSYLIPILLKTKDVPTLDESNLSYIVVKKPITIHKVFDFNGRWLDVKLPTMAKKITSVTYEALIYIDSHVKLSTIMGNEGILLFRFGDTTVDADQIQIAGKVQFNPTTKFELNKWYHVAFTYDAMSGVSVIYINGEKVADKVAGAIDFDLNQRFCIGYAYDYDASRIWRGKMSECRLWTVARTEKQIKDNIMSVDPNSDDLLGYWKLNGSDIEKRDDIYYVKDQSKNGLDAISRRGNRGEDGRRPGPSVEPSVIDLKVDMK